MSSYFRFFILVAVLPLVRVWAEPPRAVETRQTLELHRSADMTSPVVQTLSPGERVWIVEDLEGIAKLRYRRGGAWRTGYVISDRLGDEVVVAEPPSGWRVGLLGAYSVLGQGQRSFETPDGVTWTTSAYASVTAWPALFVEYGERNFWRLSVGLRRVDFVGHARTDAGGGDQPIEVKQNMISARLEHAWRLLDPAYLSLGVEFARAPSLQVRLGGATLPTTADDVKIYAGGSIGIGARHTFDRRFAGTIEARAGVYPTLTPNASVVELAVGGAYLF